MKNYLLGGAILVAAFATTLPLEAQQAPQLPGSKSVAAITGGTYQADAAHTLVGWRVDHFGFTPYFGLFGDITGTLVLVPKNPAAAKVDVTIPVARPPPRPASFPPRYMSTVPIARTSPAT